MKQNLSLLIIFIFTLFACKHSDEVNIFGKISGKIPEEISYSVPVNGIACEWFKEAVKPDSSGNFQIKINLKKPAFIIIMVPGMNYKTIVIEPGEDFRVSIDTENKSESFKITGINQAGQNLFNSLPFPRNILTEAMKYAKDPSPDSIKSKITALKADDILRFRELLAKKEISKNFFKLVSADRDCYYAALEAEIQYVKYWMGSSGNPPDQHYEFPSGMKKIWEDVYMDYPVNSNDLMISPWWFWYAITYLDYKEFLAESFTFQYLNEIRKKGLLHTHKLELAKKYLSGHPLEYITAAYIYFWCLNKEYEKEFIQILKQYKTDYPNSKYTGYFEPMINQIIDFHKIAETDFNKNVKFIDNYHKINSIKEGIESLKGKKIYVDVWATYCEPCKDEFKYNTTLREILKSRNIELLYISTDEEKRETLWKEMIKYYDLQGNHIRANKQLYSNLVKVYNTKENGIFSIPYYLLLDEKGNVIINHARKPSQIEELKKQIDEIN